MTDVLTPPTKRGPGQPTKRTPGVERELVRLLRQGNTRRAAATAIGIGEVTLWRWCRLSERFRRAIEQAEAEADTLYVNALCAKAVEGDVAAIKFWLTHRRSDEWRPPKESRELSGSVEQRVIIERVEIRRGDG